MLKIHKVAGMICCVVALIGIAIGAVENSSSGVGAKILFGAFACYIPVYCCKAIYQGKVLISAAPYEVDKVKNRYLFWFSIALYMIIAILIILRHVISS